MLLEDQLLEDYCARFFGYGNLAAPLWFLGMEEGGGNSTNEIRRRLGAWTVAGEPAVVDIVAFGEAMEHLKWFTGERPPLQSTWAPLIRTSLVVQGKVPNIERIRGYQRDEFARSRGAECLLELFPLPSPGTDRWHYSEWSDLPWLANRDAYTERLLDSRLNKLTSLIDEYEPIAVVAYSRAYRDHWSKLVDGELEEISLRNHDAKVEIGQRAGTTVYVSHHPTSFLKVRNEYFAALGELIASRTVR